MIADLVNDGGIEFSTRLDTNVKFGKNYANLIRHLSKQHKGYVRINIPPLPFEDERFLYEFTTLLVASQRVKETFFHVDVDISKIYGHEIASRIVNGAGDVIVEEEELKKWVPALPRFEKEWNFALCTATAEDSGQGYEYPRNERHFEHAIAQNAVHYLIGDKMQLWRYHRYAQKFPQFAEKIAKNVEYFQKTLQNKQERPDSGFF